jgi:hypothetical protein
MLAQKTSKAFREDLFENDDFYSCQLWETKTVSGRLGVGSNPTRSELSHNFEILLLRIDALSNCEIDRIS